MTTKARVRQPGRVAPATAAGAISGPIAADAGRWVRLTALIWLLAAAAAGADGADPRSLLAELRSSRLVPAEAVTLRNVRLASGGASLIIEDATVFPAAPVGGRVRELVLLGRARVQLEPPDAIEEQQLRLFTGDRALNETVTRAVLVVGQDAAVERILERPTSAVEADLERQAAEVFSAWLASSERRLLNVEAALLLNALGEPRSQGYFAGWFHGEEHGDFLYLVEPDAEEQVTLGQFVPVELADRERRRLDRRIEREHRRGRLLGQQVDDLGDWDTWVSAPAWGAAGQSIAGGAAFRLAHHEIEVAIAPGSLELSGRARLNLRCAEPSRAVSLVLHPDLIVEAVRDEGGAELFHHRTGDDLLVLLTSAPQTGEAVVIEVTYRGHLVEKAFGGHALRSTTDWYPSTRRQDLATFDVTYRWPRRLQLLSSGERVDGGVEAEMAWERRRLSKPALFCTFEVGRYEVTTARAGTIGITLAVDETGPSSAPDREELLAAARDALTYYQEIFGPYPFDRLVLVTSPRSFSQAAPGFITLSSPAMDADDSLSRLFGLAARDRRVVVAHEIAHQWWAHLVSWKSYRDQWLSEAMANYAALLFARRKLGKLHLSLTNGWQEDLLRTTADGRTLESLGPVVLGRRLFSSRSTAAYYAVVYKKGAVVLSMLARLFGEDTFLEVLRAILKAVPYRDISTADFFALVERASGVDLEPFTRQFIDATGLAEVHYEYRFERGEEGRWRVVGSLEQRSPYRYAISVVRVPGGGFDVARTAEGQMQVDEAVLVVPVQVAVYDPDRPAGIVASPLETGNTVLELDLVFKGDRSTFELPLDHEPKRLWLDAGNEVFARFWDSRRSPRRALFVRGLDEAAAGRREEAETTWSAALAAPVRSPDPEAGGGEGNAGEKKEARWLEAAIGYELARLHLDQERLESAIEAFAKAELAWAGTGWMRMFRPQGALAVEARLALRRGDHRTAYSLLRRGVGTLGNQDAAEGFALLAITAREDDHREELAQALEQAKRRGAEVSALEE